MNRTKRITLLIVFTLIFGIIASFHESRLGKWIDTEVYEFIYSSESFITTSILLGATKLERSMGNGLSISNVSRIFNVKTL